MGVAYQYNEYLRFAIDSQNVLYYHSQFAFPVAEAQQFNSAAKFSPQATKSGFITGPVFPDMHSIFSERGVQLLMSERNKNMTSNLSIEAAGRGGPPRGPARGAEDGCSRSALYA